MENVAESLSIKPSEDQGTPSPAMSDLFAELDPNTIRIYDVYRRASEIYHRAEAAMGREPRFRIVVSNATHVRIRHEHPSAAKIPHP